MTTRQRPEDPGREVRPTPGDEPIRVTERVVAATRKSTTATTAAVKQTSGDQTAAKKTTTKKAMAKKTTAKKSAEKTAAEKTEPGAATSSTAAPAKKAAVKRAPGAKAATKTAAKAPAQQGAGRENGGRPTQPATKSAGSKAKASDETGTGVAAAGDLSVRADEEPWTDQQLAEIREELNDEIRRHESQARTVSADLEDLLVSGDGGSGDAADIGTSNYERDQEMTLAAYAREAITQTRLALAKMDDGTYGRCDSCGQPIGKGRLQAYPRATLCLRCKQREERR